MFQVKINCSKFIIDRLQQRCHVTFLISLFVTSTNLLFGVFLPRENNRKFQASVTERCTSLSNHSGIFPQNLLKVPVKKLNLKNFYRILTSSQVIFKVSSRIFFYLFTYPTIYRSLFEPHTAHILCIPTHIFKRYYFPLLLSLRWKAKGK